MNDANNQKLNKFQRYYLRNKDKYKQYYDEHKDKIKNYSKEYYNQNKDKFRQYYLNSEEHRKEYRRQYYLKTRGDKPPKIPKPVKQPKTPKIPKPVKPPKTPKIPKPTKPLPRTAMYRRNKVKKLLEENEARIAKYRTVTIENSNPFINHTMFSISNETKDGTKQM